MSARHRREAELREKLLSVTDEFFEWRRMGRTTALEKHRSQIRRVTSTLNVLAQESCALLDRMPADPDEFRAAAWRLERTTLDLHRLWDYFRSKLLTRHVPWYAGALSAADEVTWACYAEVQKVAVAAGGGDLKEPPLVFLNGQRSPFAISRGEAYEPEPVGGEPVETAAIRDAARELPIAVVGIPWFQLRHMASAPVLCHEVGHNIEEDFGLAERIDGLVEEALADAGVDERGRRRWRRWRPEVFADIAGCAGAGEAFGAALMDFLAADPRRSPSLDYPPSGVRAGLILASLRSLQRDPRASDPLEKRWRADHPGLTETPGEHLAAVEAVVDRILNTPLPELGDRTLAGTLSFSAHAEESAAELARVLLDGGEPFDLDARLLHAAARKAFDRVPARYVQAGVSGMTAHWIRLGARSGPRSLELERGASPKELAKADIARGHALFARIHGANGGPSS